MGAAETKMADIEAIGNFNVACANKKPLEELQNLAKLIQDPMREVFSGDYWPPLHIGALYNNVPAIRMLIRELNFKVDSYVNSNSGSWSNVTPIHYAVYNEKFEAFEALLDFSPNVIRLETKAKICSKEGSVSEMIEQISDENKKRAFQRAYQAYKNNTNPNVDPKMKEENLRQSWEENLQGFISNVKKVVTMPTQNKEMKTLEDAEKIFRELSLSPDFFIEYRSMKSDLQEAKKVEKAIAVFESSVATMLSEIDNLRANSKFKTSEEIADLEKKLADMSPKIVGASKNNANVAGVDEDILPDDCPICYAIPDNGKEISMCIKCCGKCCTLCFNSVTTCPMCRASLREFKPIRNRDTEKMVAYYWKNKK